MFRRRLALTILLIGGTSSASAESGFSDGSCGLIVASRQTLADARQFIDENAAIPIHGVFESRNGWFAIASRLLREEEADAVISRLVAASVIPEDSYCSDGESYVREVVGFGSESAAHTKDADPRSGGLAPKADFDARRMTASENRLLQASLAMQGYYVGLIDGRWGRGSQRAIENFSLSRFDMSPTNAHAAAAVLFALDELADGEWAPRALPETDAYMLLPERRITTVERSPGFVKLQDAKNEITISSARNSPQGMIDLHAYTAGENVESGSPYLVRKKDFWVTSASRPGLRIYVRSRLDRTSGTWMTVVISSPSDALGSGLIISSLADAPVPPLKIPEGGYIDEQIRQLLAAIPEEDPSEPAPPAQRTARAEPEAAPAPISDTTGTGFYVTENSIAITNAHVVEDCVNILVDGIEADIVARDREFDLAALQPTDNLRRRKWLKFSDAPARLNTDIAVAGYPLPDLLGGFNVTRGAISSLKGLGGDTVIIQISAPVQPGNSGGPVVDRSGRVVGVVVAKLDALAAIESLGDVPQNVNFAIRGEVAKFFLSANGFQPEVQGPGASMAGPDLADLLLKSTALIECRSER